jgi:prepilin-type N-terminal cleavage/methylation domain-containing protein
MATSIIRRDGKFRGREKAERGFSLLEVVISMAVLTVGMVSLLGVFGLAMASTQTSQQDMIAKQLANEAYESIVTARNTAQISWDDIQNTGATYCPDQRRQPVRHLRESGYSATDLPGDQTESMGSADDADVPPNKLSRTRGRMGSIKPRTTS